MRQARSRQFDPAAPPWLHVVSRCVRGAFLCGDGYGHRKSWLERRLRILSRCFAVEVASYAVLENHLHAVVRPHPEATVPMGAEAVARAWWHLREDVDPVDGRDESGALRTVDEAHVQRLAGDEAFIARWRERLGSLSWFMKSLKEPLSRRANREDGCRGAFWEGRFTSVPLLDVQAIAACMVYVDLNPIRAQLAATPETSDYTSVQLRIKQRRAREEAGRLRSRGRHEAAAAALRKAQVEPGVVWRGPVVTAGFDSGSLRSVVAKRRPDDETFDRSWLAPVSAVIREYSRRSDDPGMSLDAYLNLVDLTGRAVRSDKRGSIPQGLERILARLDCRPRPWLDTVARPAGLRGSALGGLAARGAEAVRRGLAWVQARCPLCAAPRSSA